jgi:hypothetical protein
MQVFGGLFATMMALGPSSLLRAAKVAEVQMRPANLHISILFPEDRRSTRDGHSLHLGILGTSEISCHLLNALVFGSEMVTKSSNQSVHPEPRLQDKSDGQTWGSPALLYGKTVWLVRPRRRLLSLAQTYTVFQQALSVAVLSERTWLTN